MRATFGGAIALSNSAPHEYWTHGFIQPSQSALAGCKPVEPGCVLAIDIDVMGPSIRDYLIWKLVVPLPIIEKCMSNLIIYFERRWKNGLTIILHRRRYCQVALTLPLSWRRSRAFANSGVCLSKFLPHLGSVIPMTNDEFYARYAARKIGVPLDIIRLMSEPIQKLVFDALDHQDEPLAMLSFIPLYRLVKAAGQRSRDLDLAETAVMRFSWDMARPRIGLGNTDIPFRGECFGQPKPPRWMSAYGWRAVTTDLIGHGFAKMDRASAEQGVEMRAPLLDLDLVSFARQLSPEILLANNQPKALLKRRLRDWPDWFRRRPKLGLVHNTRWVWGIRNFAGLREIDNAGYGGAVFSIPAASATPTPPHWVEASDIRAVSRCYCSARLE